MIQNSTIRNDIKIRKDILGIKQLNKFNCIIYQKGLKTEFIWAEDMNLINSVLTQPDQFN